MLRFFVVKRFCAKDRITFSEMPNRDGMEVMKLRTYSPAELRRLFTTKVVQSKGLRRCVRWACIWYVPYSLIWWSSRFKNVVTSAQVPHHSYLLANDRAAAAGFAGAQAGTTVSGYYADSYHFADFDIRDNSLTMFTDAELTHRYAHALFNTPLLKVEVYLQALLGMGPWRTAAGTDKGATMRFDVGDKPGGIWTVVRKTDQEIAMQWEVLGMTGLTVVGVRKGNNNMAPDARTLHFGSALYRTDGAATAPASAVAITFHRLYSIVLTGHTYKRFIFDQYKRRPFPASRTLTVSTV
jgi:hypothetical protein